MRRKIIVLCDDVGCQFKQKNRGMSKLVHECALETCDAIDFFKKYGITTCELGMGEEKASDSIIENQRIIMNMKYKGRA